MSNEDLLSIGAAARGVNYDITSLNSPLLGSPRAVTQLRGDNSKKVATTEFVNQNTENVLKNRIFNGDMLIDQRNAGAVLTINSATPKRLVDMWTAIGTAAAGVFTVARQSTTPPSGLKSYLHLAVTTADATPAATSRYHIFQAIEGNNIIDFALGTTGAVQFTLAFQIRSTLTGTFSGSFENNALNRSYPYTYVINAANTWETKYITLVGDTSGTWTNDTTVGMYISFELGAGANWRGTAGGWQAGSYDGATGSTRLISTNAATMDITEVRLTISPFAPFEYKDITQKLKDTQRYFNKSYDAETVPGTGTYTGEHIGTFLTNLNNAVHDCAGGTTFSVPMRVAPTVTLYSPVTGTANKAYDNIAGADVAATIPHVGERGFVWEASAAGASVNIDIGLQWAADSSLS